MLNVQCLRRCRMKAGPQTFGSEIGPPTRESHPSAQWIEGALEC